MLVVRHHRYRQMPSLVPRQGDAAKHSIVSGNRLRVIKFILGAYLFPASVRPVPLGRIGFYSFLETYIHFFGNIKWRFQL